MINNSSFGFSPFKLNPKLEFYYLSIYSLRPTLLLFHREWGEDLLFPLTNSL